MGAHLGFQKYRWDFKIEARERSTIIALTDIRDIKILIFTKYRKKESQLPRENEIVPNAATMTVTNPRSSRSTTTTSSTFKLVKFQTRIFRET